MGFINTTFTKLQTKAEENTTFTKLQSKVEEAFDKVNNTNTTVVRKPTDSTPPTTSWGKAVANLDVIVTEVSKVDSNGVDIVCVGGKEGKPQWYRNIKSTKGLEDLVTKKKPSGKCNMGATMEEVLTDVFGKDLKKRPVTVLVLTTGQPDDTSLLEKSLLDAAKKVAKSGVKESPLSVTFIQIGEDQRAGAYLKQLETKMAGERIQIVDTMTDVEFKSTMKEINRSTKSSKTGLIAGGLAGAAISAGGMYTYNKHQEAKKTTNENDFNGQFKCFYEDEEITTLQVTDDKEGNLTIEGFHEEVKVSGKYSGFGKSTEVEVDVETEVFIHFTNPSGELVEGTYKEEERIIDWSDGSRWEAHVSLKEERVNNAKLVAGAAVVGAIAAGTTGYILDKKFFNKVSKKDNCDYIVIVDRSAKMTPHNTCATTEEIDIEIHLHEDVIKKKESATKKRQTKSKEDIDIDVEVDENIHVNEVFKELSGGKAKQTKEKIDIEIDVKIDVKGKATATKKKAQRPAYLDKH